MAIGEFDPKIRFGSRLRVVRQAKGLTQRQLAILANLDRTYISSCERGKRNVTLLAIYRLSDALGVKAKDLMPDESDLEGI